MPKDRGAERRVDWTLRGVGYQDRPEVAGPDVPEGEVVGLARVPTAPCPDCNPGDSGCGTCGDSGVLVDRGADARALAIEAHLAELDRIARQIPERPDTLAGRMIRAHAACAKQLAADFRAALQTPQAAPARLTHCVRCQWSAKNVPLVDGVCPNHGRIQPAQAAAPSEDARGALAKLALALLTTGEPTNGELRELLVEGGIRSPQEMYDAARAPSPAPSDTRCPAITRADEQCTLPAGHPGYHEHPDPDRSFGVYRWAAHVRAPSPTRTEPA
jgi:hypothetical protein